MSLLLFLLLIPYLFLIIRFCYAWVRLIAKVPPPERNDVGISIVVPMRNESCRINKLLASLARMDYPVANYELIFVDDYCTDNTREVVLSATGNENPYRYIDNYLPAGKKYALQTGVEAARFDVVVSLDADVEVPEGFLRTMAGYFSCCQPDLLIGPVACNNSGKSVAARFSAIEMTVLTTIAGASTYLGTPLLCNGANLAFRRAFFRQNVHRLNHKYASGDDIFLMLATRQGGGKSIYVNAAAVVAQVSPPESLGELVRQRLRWLSKSGGYADFPLQALALATALANLVIVAGVALVLTGHLSLGIFISLLVAKIGAEGVLHLSGARFLGTTQPLYRIVLFGLLYPWYGTLLVLANLSGISVRWK